MSNDDESGLSFSAGLIQYRVRQTELQIGKLDKKLDEKVRELEMTIEKLATKDDVAGLSKKLDDQTTELKKETQQRDERRFAWWKTILGGACGAALGAVLIFAIGSALGVHLR